MSQVDVPARGGEPRQLIEASPTRRTLFVETSGVPIRYSTSSAALGTASEGVRIGAYRDTHVTVPAGETLYALSATADPTTIRVTTDAAQTADTTASVQSVERPGDLATREKLFRRQFADYGSLVSAGSTFAFTASPVAASSYRGDLVIESVAVGWGQAVADGQSPVDVAITGPVPSGSAAYVTHTTTMPSTVKFDPGILADADSVEVAVTGRNETGSNYEPRMYINYRQVPEESQ